MTKKIIIFKNVYDLGVIAFVDYKIDNDRCDTSINQWLINLGAKVEKTFNLKVNIVINYQF